MATVDLTGPTNGPNSPQGPAENPANRIDPTQQWEPMSFFEKNKDLILYGGAGLVGIALIYYASKKGSKRRKSRK